MSVSAASPAPGTPPRDEVGGGSSGPSRGSPAGSPPDDSPAPATLRSRLRHALDDAADRFLDVVFRRGFTTSITYHLGLQGRVSRDERSLRLARRPGAPPLRIAFASDFHAGPITHARLLDRACELLAEAQPDVLLLGGDFVSLNVGWVDALFARIREIPAPLGKFAVLGNHDYRRHRARFVSAIVERAGVELITNRSARLSAPHEDVWICGLDDPISGAPNAEAALEDAVGTRVVLMHAPDGLLALGPRRFALALCGHTHGGQVALPGGRPIVLPAGRLSARYPGGLYEVGDGAHLLVSRGIGCSGLPFRVFAGPQVHLFVLGEEEVREDES